MPLTFLLLNKDLFLTQTFFTELFFKKMYVIVQVVWDGWTMLGKAKCLEGALRGVLSPLPSFPLRKKRVKNSCTYVQVLGLTPNHSGYPLLSGR